MEKKWIKLIRQLQLKKYRKEKKLFVVEGEKTVCELLDSDFRLKILFYTNIFKKNYPHFISHFSSRGYSVKASELERVGILKTNRSAVAIAETKNYDNLTIENEIILVLDNISNPGNLGTILRIADWYGIKKIVCSQTSTDLYNPKVLMASMGSFCRVQVYYTAILPFLKTQYTHINIFGCFTAGENIHHLHFPKRAIIILGNESGGIDKEIFPYIHQKITIPKYGSAESLNVAVAAGIICDNILKRKN